MDVHYPASVIPATDIVDVLNLVTEGLEVRDDKGPRKGPYHHLQVLRDDADEARKKEGGC